MSHESTHPYCPQCQAPLSEDAPQGLCPACLMAMASLPTDQDTMPLGPGDLPELADIAAAFPDLEIVEKIGRGGMGVVFKARQPRLDRTVALKVLPKALAATPGFAERFTREGRVLARLNHPSIVAVHDFGESGGYCYLIMEYVDGVNLRQAMKTGRFTPEQALKVVPDICTALQAAHEQGVLHRDIKPENILLDSKGRVKIADFGIAKLMDDRAAERLLTQSGARLGTAPYMAPEQLEQPSTVDHRADIYSLGVVLYELLTGELPLGRFAAPSEKVSVSSGVDAVVMRALEKERGRRQQSAGEMKTQIEGAATEPHAFWNQRGWNGESFEYKSKRMVWGLPLVHVVRGRDPVTGSPREAHGFFAFGDRARGIFACGGIARGWVACGGLAFGGIVLGGVGIGLISISGLALALLFGMGGFSVGFMSLGGVALGWHASGGVAIGWHALGGLVFAHQGAGGNVHATVVATKLSDMPALTRWLSQATPYSVFLGLIWVPLTLLMILVPWWARRQAEIEARGQTAATSISGWDTHPHRVFWLIAALDFVLAMGGLALVLWLRSLPDPKSLIFIPMIFSGTGLVMFAASLPLWLRLVPINPLYGVRLPATLKSSKRWYDVNAYAGKQLFLWSLAIIGAGVAGFFELPRHQESYSWAAVTLTLVAVASVVVSTLWWMYRHPADGSKVRSSRLIHWGAQAVIAIVIALFVRSFIVAAYKVDGGAETGIMRGSHWLVSRLDTGFAPGDAIVYEHDSHQHWLARVVNREEKGLMARRGGVDGEFLIPWDKVLGRLLFSHFTPNVAETGLTSNTPTSATRKEPFSDMVPAPATEKALKRLPELLFMRMAPNDQPWMEGLHDPRGKPIEITDELRKVLARTTSGASSHDKDECWLILWFRHPDFDTTTTLSARLVDKEGKPVSTSGALARNQSWQPWDLQGDRIESIVISAGPRNSLPTHAQIEVSYSLGPWDETSLMDKDPSHSIATTDWIKGGVGAAEDGNAFVSWLRRSPERQVQCVAHLKKGGARLGNVGVTSSDKDIMDQCRFRVKLGEVDHFEMRVREIRKTTYADVVLPPLQVPVVHVFYAPRSGDVPWTQGMTLADVLKQAGFSEWKMPAFLGHRRDGRGMDVQVNEKTLANETRPGDTIILPFTGKPASTTPQPQVRRRDLPPP
ncbi:MAG: protein kinase [Verrucomicrobiota bacterium]